jgi:hypothetical protein
MENNLLQAVRCTMPSECNCTRFERLEGAAVNAYTSDYLVRMDKNEEKGVSYYRCRVCMRHWKRVEDDGRRRPSLIRLIDRDVV